MARLLAVDDDTEVLDSVKDVLENAGHDVSVAGSGQEALLILDREPFDLVVLDIVMPELSGIEVCRRMRANPDLAHIPILFLTAKGRQEDIANGLDAGGDDYMIKPYGVIELPARIRAILRRASTSGLEIHDDSITFGELHLRVTKPEAEVRGMAISLTPTEHRLLLYLVQRAGRQASADQMLEDVWGYPSGVGDPQLARVHINHLRTKLERAGCHYLQNRYGSGYVISQQS